MVLLCILAYSSAKSPLPTAKSPLPTAKSPRPPGVLRILWWVMSGDVLDPSTALRQIGTLYDLVYRTASNDW